MNLSEVIASQNYSVGEIKTMFGYKSYTSIWREAKKQGIILRKNSTLYSFNESFCDSWTKESAYLIGFIAADGCINHPICRSNCTPYLYIGLALKDLIILENIKLLMFSNHPIKHSKTSFGHDRIAISLYSKHFISRLMEIGLHPRKSLVMDWLSSCPKEFISHLVRGYFDGDGSIGRYHSQRSLVPSLRVNILGTESFLLGLTKNINIPYRLDNTKTIEIKSLAYESKRAESFCEWMYQDSTPLTRLDRKYQRWINKNYC